jgi:hypothetical protein
MELGQRNACEQPEAVTGGGNRHRCISEATGSLRTRPFSFPERRKSRRLSEDVQERLARDSSPGEGSILSLADEVADEARGTGETEPPGQRN